MLCVFVNDRLNKLLNLRWQTEIGPKSNPPLLDICGYADFCYLSPFTRDFQPKSM